MGYILGIDQGGTKTHAAVMDLGANLLSCARSGGCYFQNDGIANAVESIAGAVEVALSGAGIAMRDVDLVVAGVTGIDWPGEDELVASALRERIGDVDIIACNDCEIAYYGGSLNPVGAVICAGTGLNVALFGPNGDKLVLGDYVKPSLQGGSAIARMAFEAVVDSDLGALPSTELTKLFCDLSGDRSVHDLLWRMMTTEGFSREIITLVPRIIGIAGGGDPVAQGVLGAFADGLCGCFVAAMGKMGMLDAACDIVLAGSVLKGRANGLKELVAQRIRQHAKRAAIIDAQFEPIVGACIMGCMNRAGAFDDRMISSASASAERLGLLRMPPV